MDNIDNDLKKVLSWTKEKLQGEEHPPWAWYNYMKLQEALNGVIKGRSSQTVNLPQLDEHQETHLQLVDSKYQQDTSQRHLDIDDLPLPM